MAWTLCSSGAAISKAGANSESNIKTSGAILADWSDEAEGAICAECHTDFVTNYADYDTEIQNALQTISAAKIAKQIIAYDMSGFTSTREAETMLDYLDDVENKALQTLKDKKFQRFSS